MKRLSSAVAAMLFLAVPALASFHLMQIEQVIGGVAGDVTAQAIQLRMRSSLQNQVQLSRVVAWDATGANPVVIATPGSAVAGSALGDRVLIASAGFVAATNPAATPDFTMTALIPPSYLAAGSLTFESSNGLTIYWRLSWGGAGYTGSNMGAVTNDADRNFGPPIATALPSAGTAAVLFQGTASALSTNNLADYAVTTGDAVFTNNAGQSFTVQAPPTAARGPATGIDLRQNHPNPFNPSTEIPFTLAQRTHVTLRIYDATGALVTTLLDGVVSEGPSQVTWDGRDRAGNLMGSGVYFYRLTGPGQDLSRKMLMLK